MPSRHFDELEFRYERKVAPNFLKVGHSCDLKSDKSGSQAASSQVRSKRLCWPRARSVTTDVVVEDVVVVYVVGDVVDVVVVVVAIIVLSFFPLPLPHSQTCTN